MSVSDRITCEEALRLARETTKADEDPHVGPSYDFLIERSVRLSRFVEAVLGDVWTGPGIEVVIGGQGPLVRVFGTTYFPATARAIASALLRAADAAEGKP